MYVYHVWELKLFNNSIKRPWAVQGGRGRGAESWPGVDVSKKAADRGVGSKAQGLMSEPRDKLLLATGKQLKKVRHPKAFFRSELTTANVTR